MQFKALSFLALLAVLAAASPVPQPQAGDVTGALPADEVTGALPADDVPGGTTADGGETTVGEALGKAAAVAFPDSVIVSGIEGANGTPGPAQNNPGDSFAKALGSGVKAAAPKLADGAVTGAGGTPGP
jgi:hypothetical protein